MPGKLLLHREVSARRIVMNKAHLVIASLLFSVTASLPAMTDASTMSFFVASVGGGDGANPGGLDGADAHCAALASDTSKAAVHMT